MDYKNTLTLPDTKFPMRANLPENEPIRYERWYSENVFEKMKQRRQSAVNNFTLHDGPPYANGNLHIGHALNKILKDIIVKFYYFKGYSVRFTPGWDCHGLPIEHEIEKQLGKEKKEVADKNEIRSLCRKHAEKFVALQKDEFKRMGVIADWERPYLTMDYRFEANIFRTLCAIAESGLLVQRKKPVYWSWAAMSALAEAEVEYKDKEDFSVFVAFSLSHNALEKLKCKKASIVIWTTTPWTLPSNTGISLNPHEEYVLTDDGYIVALKLYESCKADGVINGNIQIAFGAALLENEHVINPLNGRQSKIVLGEHVTMDGGTGCVHTAPGHGEDDYRVGLKYGLPLLMPVDEKGLFDETVVSERLLPNPEEFVGVHVFKANEKILDILGPHLLKCDKFIHSYPHCWRTRTPLIYRATKQWFISMDDSFKNMAQTLRGTAAKEITGSVKFYPPQGQNRLLSMIENRPDWCISRQRDWGVPIAFFKNKKSGEIVFEGDVLAKTAEIFEEHGSDAWYQRPNGDFIPEGCDIDPDELEKEMDILDVWFDSGSTFYATLLSGDYDAGRYPATVYLEGSDQHRGWFQSSLLLSSALFYKAPYDRVITHGFTLDGAGKKMSKSLGNAIPPEKILKEYGSEILRLWVATCDYQSDMAISDGILKQVAEQYRKIRNTFRFLLANINDLEEIVHPDKLGVLDRWILSEAKKAFDEVDRDFWEYEFAKGMSKLNAFITAKLSNIYLDVCKDRLYCDAKDDIHRRASQSAMALISESLLTLIAPVLTYTADEIIEFAPAVIKNGKSDIFEFYYEPMMEIQSDFDAAYMEEARDKFFEIVDTLKKEAKIKTTLEVKLATDSKKLLSLDATEVSDYFLISETVALDKAFSQEVLGKFSVNENRFEIVKSNLCKCPRCWKHLSISEDALCERCQKVV